MSKFDSTRLSLRTFKLDIDRMRRGWYSDKYFTNTVEVLTELASQGYTLTGTATANPAVNAAQLAVGDIEVEMQWFTRRKPLSVVAGVDKALAMLQTCTGYFDDSGEWVSTFHNLQVEAVEDGEIVMYDGDVSKVKPVLRVRGRYRDFAMLETPTLGALTRGTRIATNVYNVLSAAKGKSVLFFPARFDAHELQAADGYAYHIAVQAYNQHKGLQNASHVSTNEQGDWWGGAGGGTVAHAAIACFLGDTTATMMAFAEHLPVDTPRIALVDFENDCCGTTRKVMKSMFLKSADLIRNGKLEEAKKYTLFGVRPDTGGNMRDVSVEMLGDQRLDNGVNPRLVLNLREAIDTAWLEWDIPEEDKPLAREWCKQVKIIVTGGFTPEKIQSFEAMHVPVDIYGVGSALLSNCSDHGTGNDFTSDIVKVKIGGEWIPLAKIGRSASDNPNLLPFERLSD